MAADSRTVHLRGRGVVVALTYLRRNRVEVELAETYGVSQPTISRAITTVTPLIEKALKNYVPTADELDDQTLYLIDGTLLPCWSWASHPQLYSGKHQSTGVNVQVAAPVYGRLAWISEPVEGRRHDTYCLNTSGVLHTLDPHNWVGDKAYVGYGMDTPIKKAGSPRAAGLGKRVQPPDQQAPVSHRTGDREPEDLADFAHWLPSPDLNIHGDHLGCCCTTFLHHG